MPPILVSVVIPVRDAGDLLLEALASVARQQAGPIETIVVDDGSRDDPAGRLERSPVPVRLLRLEGRGPSAARNRGAADATGRYVAFLDADDLWPRHALATMLAALEEAPGVDVAHGQVRRFRDAAPGEFDGPATVLGRIAGGFNLGSALFRRAVVARLGGFDEALRTSEDVDFWIRSRAAGIVRRALPQVTLYYRRGHGSLMEGFGAEARRRDHLGLWMRSLARVARERRPQGGP
ncbi:glycosyltransferase family 2 protein [Stella sp.]|uniref:glycosyltransferase family 2 protein n=1 Tax=Stella sp. TaxID=2912054 RepID=UPI0035ADD031